MLSVLQRHVAHLFILTYSMIKNILQTPFVLCNSYHIQTQDNL